MRIHKVHIIAEGLSEKAYFTELSKLCRELGIPVLFETYSCGTNTPREVKRQWSKAQTKRDKKINEEVWAVLDYDCFKRGKPKTASFAFTKGQLYFFIMNFEDFLVNHLSPTELLNWKNICIRSNHFSSPMHGDDVVKKIQAVIPGYSKGNLPFSIDTDCLNSLNSNKGNFHICPGVSDFINVYLAFLKQKSII
ncbi:MAG: RloB family protein [Elusimicrobiota bacterium]|jgi:hypothetical protein|nr:RloB family protein [Elusimicrobiota bacterium]